MHDRVEFDFTLVLEPISFVEERLSSAEYWKGTKELGWRAISSFSCQSFQSLTLSFQLFHLVWRLYRTLYAFVLLTI